jgi:hypothetical protein
MDAPYSNRELDSKFRSIDEKLDQILSQTTKHNGRMTRMEKTMLVVGTAVVVLVALKFPELLAVIRIL